MDSLQHRFIAAHVQYGWIGVLVEFGAETKASLKTAEFRRLSTDIATQIAVVNPADVSGLLAQTFFKDQALTVADVLRHAAKELRETIVVTRFVRWAVFEKPDDGGREHVENHGNIIPFDRP